MTRLYVNNFRTTLAGAITNSATTATLSSITGLPTLTGNDYYYLTIDGGNGTYEIVKVTSRASTTVNIVRAQEGTTAVAWGAGAVVELRATATTHVDIENDTRNWNTTGYIAVGGGTSVSSLRWLEASANGTNYVGFQAPASLSANRLWVLPSADGTANQALKTDGAGNLGWMSVATSVSSDTNPSLGGNLSVAGYKITSVSNGNVVIEPNGTGAVVIGGNATQPAELRFMEDSDNGTNYVGFKASSALAANVVWTLPTADGTVNQFLKTDGAGQLSWGTASGGTGITAVVDDAAPRLGGDLDVNAKKITSATNGDVIIQPNGTGAILIGGNATQPAELRFMEASGNGTNYVGFKSSSSLTANKIWTLPTADGSANQVLKTDGSGTLGWVTAGGAFTLISSATASSSASLSFTSLGDYSAIKFIIVDMLPATDGVYLDMYLSTNNGSTWATGYTSANYGRKTNTGAVGEGGSSISTIRFCLTAETQGNVANNEVFCGEVNLHNPASSIYKTVTAKYVYMNTSTVPICLDMGSLYPSATAVNAVKFQYSSGNIASGSIYVYGVSKT